MDTPTFQAAPEDLTAPLDKFIAGLLAGEVDTHSLTGVSDLSRLQMKQLRSTWPEANEPSRLAATRLALEQAREHLDLDFRRFFQVALTDTMADVRVLAIAGLTDDDSQSMAEEIMRLAGADSSLDVRAAALGWLVDHADSFVDDNHSASIAGQYAALVIGLAALEDLPTAVRARAIEAVGTIPQTIETRALINNAWEHGDAAYAVAALLAISHSREARWRSLVRPLLDSDDADIRFGALRALGEIGTSDDVEEIAPLVQDDDIDVQIAAIVALGEIASPGAIRILRNLMNDGTDDVQLAVQDALDNAMIGSDIIR